MTAAQHTQGPWGTHFHPAHGHCITRLNEHGMPLSGDIAVVFMADNGRTREQCKADARLIATSPDLLDELRVARAALADFAGLTGPHAQALARRFAETIAKAEGSAS